MSTNYCSKYCATIVGMRSVRWPNQALNEARQRAERAAATAAAAEKALAGLETGIPKARMEAAAQRAKADDLAARLGSLRAATQASHR